MTCRIEATEIAVFGKSDSVFVEWPQAMWVDRRGRYLFTLPNGGEVPVVYAPSGKLIARIGRTGAGPGEFRAAAQIASDRHDTIFVADWTGRLSVFDPRLNFVRAFAFPAGAGSLLPLSTGHLIVNAGLSSREDIGLPFHEYDRAGRRRKSFGGNAEPILPDEQWKLVYRLAPSAKGGFWAATGFGSYRIERWLEERRTVLLERKPAWFVPPPDRRGPIRTEPSRAIGLWEDPQSMIWVATLAPDPDRAAARRETIRTPEGSVTVPVDQDRAWDTIVEALDPDARRVVATRRFDQYFALTSPEGLVAHVTERPDGFFTVHVLALRLARRGLTNSRPPASSRRRP